MADPNVPTRNQIAKVANNDPEMIKALERLFIVAGDLTPADVAALTILIEAAAYDAGVANNKAESYQPNFQKLDYIDFNRVGPHVAAARRMQWNEPDGTIDVGLTDEVMLQVGQETMYRVKNEHTYVIPNGTVCRASGVTTDGYISVSGFIATTISDKKFLIGVATADINPGEYGYVTNFGFVRDVDTSAFPVGSVLYASDITLGALTTTKPTAPTPGLIVALCAKRSATEGVILVRIEFGSAVEELEDVYAPTPADGEILEYDSGNARWENVANPGRTSNTLIWLECY